MLNSTSIDSKLDQELGESVLPLVDSLMTVPVPMSRCLVHVAEIRRSIPLPMPSFQLSCNAGSQLLTNYLTFIIHYANKIKSEEMEWRQEGESGRVLVEFNISDPYPSHSSMSLQHR